MTEFEFQIFCQDVVTEDDSFLDQLHEAIVIKPVLRWLKNSQAADVHRCSRLVKVEE